MKLRLPASALCLLAVLPNAYASSLGGVSSDETQLSLSRQCQKIQRNIDVYSELQARGGTAGELNRWQRRQDRYLAQHRELPCQAQGHG